MESLKKFVSNFQKRWRCLVKKAGAETSWKSPLVWLHPCLQVYKSHFDCHMRRNGGCWLLQLGTISRVINSSDQGMPFPTGFFFVCVSFYTPAFGWKCKWLRIWYQTLQTSEGQIAWKSFLGFGLFNPIFEIHWKLYKKMSPLWMKQWRVH